MRIGVCIKLPVQETDSGVEEMGVNMGDIFLEILNRSIAAGWLILVVILLRILFRKAPKWIHCLLWGIVAVRLVCPFSIESVYSLIPSAETVRQGGMEEGQIHSHIPQIDSSFPAIDRTVNPILRDAFTYGEEESVAPLQVYTETAGIVWVCGLALLLGYAVITRLRLAYLMGEAVCREKNVYLCDRAVSPFVLGMIRPRIYLPSGMEPEQIPYVTAHEQAHLRRKDHWWKPLGYLLLAVYWFQPLCWVAYILFCRDIEFACDEKVIQNMAFLEKKEYSRALLSCGSRGRMVLACPLAFGEVGVKERVKLILHYKKAAVWLLGAAVAVCVIVGICFLTNPPREYQVRITVPAGSAEPFAYSDAEICPKNGTITVYAGEGLGDTEILLLPAGSPDGSEAQPKPSSPVYITQGMPVRLDVERGTWYRVGVNVQNTGTGDRDVFVTVKNVDIRIADSAGTDLSRTEGDGTAGANGMGTGGAESGTAGTGGTGADAAGVSGAGSGAVGANAADAGGTGADAADANGAEAGISGTQGDGKPGQSGTGSGENAGQAEDMYAPHRYDMGDLDGNGEQEYVMISFLEDDPDHDGHLDFYFNGELIYEYDDILWMWPGNAEYIDLDGDGKQEIFFTFNPNVNSMPLMEYAVLKQTGSSWTPLEMIHGETMLDNEFPITSRYKEENTIVITCEGTDQEIVYNFKEYYENRIREEQEYGGDPKRYAEILEQQGEYKYREGDEFGGIAEWGIWEICSGTHDGRNCLIATHGLEGPLGKWDNMGLVDVYFDYDERGQVHILNLDFREEL